MERKKKKKNMMKKKKKKIQLTYLRPRNCFTCFDRMSLPLQDEKKGMIITVLEL